MPPIILPSVAASVSANTSVMHPTFGVPWPRLQKAAARLAQLHANRGERGRVSALLFLCGVKYLVTYREANKRRLAHYLDDGLREAVEHTLPVLMKRSAESPMIRGPGTRRSLLDGNVEFAQLVFGFGKLNQILPSSTLEWAGRDCLEMNLIRLIFGMGVAARFSPSSHEFLRRMFSLPLHMSVPVQDVLESFTWDPEWSLAIAA